MRLLEWAATAREFAPLSRIISVVRGTPPFFFDATCLDNPFLTS